MSSIQTTLTTEHEGNGFYIAQYKTSDLAIFSYYVESNKSAFIIDPTFDIQVYEDLIAKRGSKLQYVLLTHYHADFISGHTQFKVPIIMGENSQKNVNGFKVTQIKDGQNFSMGSITVVVLHTPGHTPESASYLLHDSDKKNVVLFSGDTVFLGDVGRPDLAVAGTLTKEDLAGMLYDSVQKLKKLDPEIRLYPGHGSGSACGKAIGAGNFCTLGVQGEKNYGFTIQSKEQFIKKLTEGIAKPPAYFFHDAKTNQEGPGSHEEEFKKANVPLSIEQFKVASEKAIMVDTRPNLEGGLIKSSYWIPSSGAISGWISMVSKAEDPVIIITDEGKHVELIQRLLRIGYFNIKGYNNFKAQDYPAEKFHPKIIDGKEALTIQNRTHLDVRNLPEWKETGVFENAILIPLGQLKNRTEEAKDKTNLVVSCRSGLRARFAYSILANAGIDSTVIVDMVQNYKNQGHKMVEYKA